MPPRPVARPNAAPRDPGKSWQLSEDEFMSSPEDYLQKLRSVFGDKLRRGKLDLPALPEVAVKLNELANSSNSTVNQAVKLVEGDPQLAVRVLRIASSPMFGMQQVADLHRATIRIGINGLRDIAFALMMGQVFRCPGLEEKMRGQIRHSYMVANGTARICKLARIPGGLGFMCGLLHDVGRLALMGVIVNLSKRTKDWLDPHIMNYCMDKLHAEAGELVVSAWDLSSLVGQVACHHHTPDRAGEAMPLAYAAAVANTCAHIRAETAADRADQLAREPLAHKAGLKQQHFLDVAEVVEKAGEDADALIGSANTK